MEVIRPADYDAVAAELALRGADARVLGGGQSLAILIRLGFMAPEALISLAGCNDANRLRLATGHLQIGPRWTVAQAAVHPVIKVHAPGLARAAAIVASPHVRNFATVLGNICHADPANDLAAPLLCYDARVVARSAAAGARLIELEDFFCGPYETALAEDEFATGVELRRLGDHGAGYRKVVWRGADHPVASAAVVLKVRDGKIQDVRVALGACVSVPCRLSGVEHALTGVASESVTADTVRDLVAEAAENLDFRGEPDIPARYRRSVSGWVVADAVASAMARDGGPATKTRS